MIFFKTGSVKDDGALLFILHLVNYIQQSIAVSIKSKLPEHNAIKSFVFYISGFASDRQLIIKRSKDFLGSIIGISGFSCSILVKNKTAISRYPLIELPVRNKTLKLTCLVQTIINSGYSFPCSSIKCRSYNNFICRNPDA